MIEVAVAAAGMGVASQLHCAAMCGPLVAAGAPGRRVVPWAIGRLTAYACVGALLGHGAGRAVGLLGSGGRAALSIGLGLVLVAVALRRLARPPADAPISLGRGPRRAARASSLGLGVLTGFLPCGALVPAWLLAAAQGSALAGATAMAAFALASLPGAPLGAWLLRRAARAGLPASPRLAAAGVALAGLWLLLRPLWDARCH